MNNCAKTPRASGGGALWRVTHEAPRQVAHLGELCCKKCATSDHAGLWPRGQAGLCGTF